MKIHTQTSTTSLAPVKKTKQCCRHHHFLFQGVDKETAQSILQRPPHNTLSSRSIPELAPPPHLCKSVQHPLGHRTTQTITELFVAAAFPCQISTTRIENTRTNYNSLPMEGAKGLNSLADPDLSSSCTQSSQARFLKPGHTTSKHLRVNVHVDLESCMTLEALKQNGLHCWVIVHICRQLG